MKFQLLLLLCYFSITSCTTAATPLPYVTAEQTRVRNAYDFEVVNCKFIRELEAHVTLFDHTYWKFIESEGPISHYGYAVDTIHLRVRQNGGNTFVIQEYKELAGNKVYIQGKAYECPPQKKPIRRDSREMQL